MRETAELDCGDNSCLFAPKPKGGMRTNGGCRCLDGLRGVQRIRVQRALTAERVARARAERERDELARQLNELVGDDDSDTDHDVEMCEMCDELGRDGMVRAVLRERDTLRQHNAVLRAECQAGRAFTDFPKADVVGWMESGIAHAEARKATDAAGAMGDTEVRRG